MKIAYLLPHRAREEQNVIQEVAALEQAGHTVKRIAAPRPGLAGVLWMNVTGVRKAIAMKPDVVSSRDLDTLKAGVSVKRQTGAKLVYDAHEVYSMMVENDVPRFLLRLINRHERRLLHKVDSLIASDQARATWVVEQGYPADRPLSIVYNCRDPIPYTEPAYPTQLFYGGTLHSGRFIREMVAAVQDDRLKGVSLCIAGPKTPNSEYDWLFRNFYASRGPVRFLGSLEPQDMLKALQNAAISIQVADPLERINTLGPYSRLFDAMAVGRPSIGSIGTENGNVITNLKIGTACLYDVESFIGAVLLMMDDKEALSRMGKRAHDLCEKVFNWQAEAQKLVVGYEV